MPTRRRILEGLRVADFSWVGVGPVTTKYLADHGADVIRVESLDRPDTLRNAAPFVGGVPGYERSGHFFNLNSSKRSICIDLKRSEGREVARRLIEHSDIVAESFTSRVMKGWGLDYEQARQMRPDIVFISMSMEGRVGPHKDNLGFGTALQAMAGYSYITGWPDRAPTIPSIPYTDWMVPQLAAFALLSAIEHRNVTGEGQWIDLSQLEAGSQGLGALLLNAAVNGQDAQRVGTEDRYRQRAPHGTYPSTGDDRWVSLVVHNDDDWACLAREMVADGVADAADPRWATAEARYGDRVALDELVGRWTRRFDAHALMQRLQRVGLDVGAVQNQQQVTDDPQLKHRGHAQPVDHPVVGVQAYDSYSFRLDGDSTELGSAPLLGQHTFEVLTQVLGYSEAEFTELVETGVAI